MMNYDELFIFMFLGFCAFIILLCLLYLLYYKLSYIRKIKKQPHKFKQLLYYHNTIQQYLEELGKTYNILVEKTEELNKIYKALFIIDSVENVDKITLSKKKEIQNFTIRKNYFENSLKELDNEFEELKKELKVNNCDTKLIERLIK